MRGHRQQGTETAALSSRHSLRTTMRCPLLGTPVLGTPAGSSYAAARRHSGSHRPPAQLRDENRTPEQSAKRHGPQRDKDSGVDASASDWPTGGLIQSRGRRCGPELANEEAGSEDCGIRRRLDSGVLCERVYFPK
ncbi:hypothetical protein NFI96_008397 [Prochilodus magdalenae]|nr:hypothetical protein NFI96_008397 [Prochilodus magdalenae]